MRLTYKYEKSNGYGSVKTKNLPPDPFIDKMSYLDDAWEEQRNKLGQLEDIMEKYDINSAEELEHIILNDTTGEQSFNDYIKPYKNIEEELGIDLITLFKALKGQIWYKYDNEIYHGVVEHFVPHMDKQLHVRPLFKEVHLSLKDYGKTWALTKEEL